MQNRPQPPRGTRSSQIFNGRRTETSHLKSFVLICSPHYVQGFLCQCSLEAKGSDSRFAIGDGAADFGWIGSRDKAKAHEPRDCEVVSSGIPDRTVSSGVKPTIRHSIFLASLLNLKQVLVRKQLIAVMPKRQVAAAALPHIIQTNHSGQSDAGIDPALWCSVV
jgi:hypothetical protein